MEHFDPPTGHLGGGVIQGGILKKIEIPLTTGPSKTFPSSLQPDASFRGGEGIMKKKHDAWDHFTPLENGKV